MLKINLVGSPKIGRNSTEEQQRKQRDHMLQLPDMFKGNFIELQLILCDFGEL
jgi:hypothetical protein